MDLSRTFLDFSPLVLVVMVLFLLAPWSELDCRTTPVARWPGRRPSAVSAVVLHRRDGRSGGALCGLVCDSLVYLDDDLTCGLESAELGVVRADPVRHHATQCGRWAGPLSLPPGSRWPEQPGRRAARRSGSPPHLEPDFLRRTETVVRGILDGTIILFSPSSPALRFVGDEGLGFATAALAASLAALARACIAASCSGGPKRRFAPNAFWTSAAWGATQELQGKPDKSSFGFERQRPQNDHSRRSKVSTPTLASDSQCALFNLFLRGCPCRVCHGTPVRVICNARARPVTCSVASRRSDSQCALG